MRLALRIGRHLDDIEYRPDPLADFRSIELLLFQSKRNVLPGRHVREQRVGLEHHVGRTFVGRNAGHVLAIDENRAGRRRIETGQHAQQGRLAAPGPAEQTEDLALIDAQRDIVHRNEIAKLLGDSVEAHIFVHGFSGRS